MWIWSDPLAKVQMLGKRTQSWRINSILTNDTAVASDPLMIRPIRIQACACIPTCTTHACRNFQHTWYFQWIAFSSHNKIVAELSHIRSAQEISTKTEFSEGGCYSWMLLGRQELYFSEVERDIWSLRLADIGGVLILVRNRESWLLSFLPEEALAI